MKQCSAAKASVMCPPSKDAIFYAEEAIPCLDCNVARYQSSCKSLLIAAVAGHSNGNTTTHVCHPMHSPMPKKRPNSTPATLTCVSGSEKSNSIARTGFNVLRVLIGAIVGILLGTEGLEAVPLAPTGARSADDMLRSTLPANNYKCTVLK